MVYAATVDGLNQHIGRVIAQLKKMDELDNTLIVVLSDNDGYHEQIKNGEISSV